MSKKISMGRQIISTIANRNNWNMKVSSLTVALIAFTTPQAHAESEFLTGKQLRSIMVGKTLTYSGPTSGTFSVRANGTAAVNDSKAGRISGRWWIKGRSFCRKFKRGKAKCLRYRALGNGRYRSTNGYIFVAN